jgi:hypothetical protein
VFNFASEQENESQNHNEITPLSSKNISYQKHKRLQVLSRMWRKGIPFLVYVWPKQVLEKREHLQVLGSNANKYCHYGKQYGGSSKY